MVNLKKTYRFLLISLIIFGALYLAIYQLGRFSETMSMTSSSKDNIITKEEKVLGAKDKQQLITIAICPTYQFLSVDLQSEKIKVINISSTSESVVLLRKGEVDVIISGRKPLPTEQDLSFKVIELVDHFSFLSNTLRSIYGDELITQEIYTDQNIEYIKEIFSLKNVVKVENVYDYLDKGIVITSWENTNYLNASLVHVLNMDGTRHVNSRTLVVYSLDEDDLDYGYSLLVKILNTQIYE